MRLEDGTLVTGNNQENAAYPSGLCAERTAIFAAHAAHPDKAIVAIAVTAKIDGKLIPTICRPCGSCLQVMAETQDRHNTPLRIIMDGASGIEIVNGIDTLLPFRFKGSDLTG